MTKGEWMKEHELYVSNVNPTEEITDEWVEQMESLIKHFDEMYNNDELE